MERKIYVNMLGLAIFTIIITAAATLWVFSEFLTDRGQMLVPFLSDRMLVPFLIKILLYLFFVAMIIFALSTFLAYRVTKNIMKPIYEIDLEHPREDYGYDELAPFLLRIKEQNRLIDTHIQSLAAEKDTINTIVNNMREGLVLLDSNGKILVVNKSAARQLRVPIKRHVGQPFIFMTRNLTLGNAVEEALEGKHGSGSFKTGTRDYQYIANTVYENNEINGAILLLFDTTEEQRAQKLRQEFSANVSHELKTPLTSIFGFAEILESGMAEGEDIVTFAGKIRSEASRLLSLIEDIIKLSKLDEAENEKDLEPVNLLEIARSVAGRLKEMAQTHNVEIVVKGGAGALAGAGPGAGAVADSAAELGVGADAYSDTDAGARDAAESDSGAGAVAGTGSSTIAESAAYAGTVADSDAGNGSGIKAATASTSGADSDTDAGARDAAESDADSTVDSVADSALNLVAGEATMIDELILNLMENAVKYNKPGGLVTVVVSRVDDRVNLAVQDTGIGIPKEELNRVFERFYRADKSHSKTIGGTGLGLAIVKHIAQYHNATLDIESEENIGTTVTVGFPVVD